jgi:CheY-like chemotaxis protein
MLLVADANESFASAVCDRAELCGWQTASVRDGEAALAAFSARPISLAIVDANLPGVQAGEVVAAARRHGQASQVVFVHDQARGMTECLRLPEVLCAMTREALLDSLAGILLGHEPAPEGAGPAAELEAQSRVKLGVLSGPVAGSYDGLVVDSGAQHVCISAWDLDGSPIDLSLGTPVTVGFAGPKGWGEVRSTVTGSYVRGSVIELTLRRPSEVSYRQRRQAQRQIVTLPIWAWPAEGADVSGRMASGRTEDISRLGVRACFSTPLAFEGCAVLSIVSGRSRRASRTLAESVWHEPVPSTGEHRYGFRFVNLSAAAAQSLEHLLETARSWGRGLSGRSGSARSETAPGDPDS